MNGSASNPDYFHKLSATLDAMADPDPYCKALTQDPHTKKHTGPRCSRRKIHDDTKSQQSKTIQDLVDDELCNQHKLMRERFMVSHCSTSISKATLISVAYRCTSTSPTKTSACVTKIYFDLWYCDTKLDVRHVPINHDISSQRSHNLETEFRRRELSAAIARVEWPQRSKLQSYRSDSQQHIPDNQCI